MLLNLQRFQQHGLEFSLFIYCWFCSGFFQNGGKVNIYFGPMKFGLGLTLLGLGFGFFSLWSMGINADSVVRVSMFWLIAAYLFHTLGELCILR
jgi:POT family proton-dependent oligopeptide transporter